MSNGGAPCGACKFLRRKCVKECIFAPYFGSEQGAARFAAVHKIFGASNVSKLLQLIPVTKRCDAVLTITYEAQARISDPVYGCVAQIFTLQQQVASLQAELAIVQAQLASQKQLAGMQSLRHQPVANLTTPMGFPTRSEPNSLLFEASLLTTDPTGTGSSLSFPTNISLNSGGGSGYEVKKENEGVGGMDFLEVVGSNSDPRGSSPPHHHLSFMSYQPIQQQHHHHHQSQTNQHGHDGENENNKLQPFDHHPLLCRK